MLFTDLIVIWLEVLFLAMEDNRQHLKAERNKKRDALERQVIIIAPSVFLVLAYLHIERWLESSSLLYSIVHVLKNLAEFSPFIWYLVVHKYDEIRAGYSYMYEQLHVHSQVHEQEQNHRSVTNAMRSMSDRLAGVLPEKNTLKNLALMFVFPPMRVFNLFFGEDEDDSGVGVRAPKEDHPEEEFHFHWDGSTHVAEGNEGESPPPKVFSSSEPAPGATKPVWVWGWGANNSQERVGHHDQNSTEAGPF
jgi:hypothetical protein